MEQIQRYSPHHAITAPLGMMRYDDEGQYVLHAAHIRRVAELKALLREWRNVIGVTTDLKMKILCKRTDALLASRAGKEKDDGR
jgi:hypothetical protein